MPALITLDEARDEMERIERFTEPGMCRPHLQWADSLARDLVPSYFLGGKHEQRYEEVKAALEAQQEAKRRSTEDRKRRKQQRAAVALLARLAKVRGANDPEWDELRRRAEQLR